MTYSNCERDRLEQKFKCSVTFNPTFNPWIISCINFGMIDDIFGLIAGSLCRTSDMKVFWPNTITFQNVFLTLALVVVQAYERNFPGRLDNAY